MDFGNKKSGQNIFFGVLKDECQQIVHRENPTNLPGLGRIVRLVRMVRLIPALKSMVYLILAFFGFEAKTLDKPHGKGKERLYLFLRVVVWNMLVLE